MPSALTRITSRPDVCAGKPCIRDLRFPVSRLLGLLAAGQSPEEILRAYPYLEPADIQEAPRDAASLAEDESSRRVRVPANSSMMTGSVVAIGERRWR